MMARKVELMFSTICRAEETFAYNIYVNRLSIYEVSMPKGQTGVLHEMSRRMDVPTRDLSF